MLHIPKLREIITGVRADKIAHIPYSDIIAVLLVGIKAAERVGIIYDKRVKALGNRVAVSLFFILVLLRLARRSVRPLRKEKVGGNAAFIAEKLILPQTVAALFANWCVRLSGVRFLPALMRLVELCIYALSLFFPAFTVVGCAALGAYDDIVLRGKFFSAGLTFAACIIKQYNASFVLFGHTCQNSCYHYNTSFPKLQGIF